MSREIEIFTDGACSGNPGPGGYGALLSTPGKTREIVGFSPHTTNNRMEMLAAIRALEALTRPSTVRLTTDSQYLKRGITEWILSWKRRGWKNSQGKPVANVDLWKRLDELAAGHRIHWHWVEGHAGHNGNELADRLARRGIEEGRAGRLAPDPMGEGAA